MGLDLEKTGLTWRKVAGEKFFNYVGRNLTCMSSPLLKGLSSLGDQG